MIRNSMALLACLVWLAGCQTNGAHPDSAKTQKRAEIHYQLGVDALSKHDLPKAFDELMEAQKLAPERSDILDALGYAWRLRGDLKKANSFYLEAIRHQPGSATYNNYGSLLMQMHKPVEAEKYFRQALDDPKYMHPEIAYINLGDALLAQGRFNEAIAAYHQANTLDPQQQVARLHEAQAYLSYHRPTYARAIYETILRDYPANLAAMKGLLSLLEKQDDLDAAQQWLERFRDKTPAPLNRAWAEEQLNRLKQ